MVTNTVDDGVTDSRTRPPPETFMFNDVTAAMFKEWHVVKKNKYGKRQQRMLGIDLNKTYNRKVGERVIKSRNTTKIVSESLGWCVELGIMTSWLRCSVYHRPNDRSPVWNGCAS